jgi:MFS transporter, Spinster family, sphingosine-1-phosphate transporter
MASLTGLFYVVTGIQYWLPNYLRNVLHVPAQTATYYFVIVSLSAPIGGVIVGGIITSAYGGYNTRKAQKL